MERELRMIKQKSKDFELFPPRILLRKDVSQSKGKIILPSEEEDQTAIVVSSSVPNIKPGYRVLLGKYTGTDYEFEDGTFTMCLEEHIMGVQTSA